jgi:hypothetical protein
MHRQQGLLHDVLDVIVHINQAALQIGTQSMRQLIQKAAIGGCVALLIRRRNFPGKELGVCLIAVQFSTVGPSSTDAAFRPTRTKFPF